MNKRLEFLLDGFYKNESGLSDEIIDRVEREIGFRFPADYLEVMRAFDGGEGRVGGNGWLLLFPLQEIVPTNEAYEILMSQIPDYFLFGKDSADTGYAFFKPDGSVHSFGLMSVFPGDLIRRCGSRGC